ncbi:hypothetical protein C0992_001649 [Termitomyces sp. T32_za158]|nr:hypothetical protein C0992_001649 [Termitomyces sp. T32_za158]
MTVAYGIDVLPENDPYIAIAETAMHGMSEVTIPGAFLVEFIPLLKYIPAWMPGAGFKRKARMWRDYTTQVVEKPFAAVQQSLAKGEAMQPSFVSYCLESLESSAEDTYAQQRIIQDTAASLYEGDLTPRLSPLPPESIDRRFGHNKVQQKAQEEIDSILPPGHLPDFSDEQALPYLSAIVKEVLRAILHDETIYPNPDMFNPDRFMKDGKLNPEIRDPSVVFGFGRR